MDIPNPGKRKEKLEKDNETLNTEMNQIKNIIEDKIKGFEINGEKIIEYAKAIPNI